MLNQKLSDLARNGAADYIASLLDGGTLCLYASEQPDSGNVPASEGDRVATLRYGSPAFAPAKDGVTVANPIASDDYAARTAKARWFRTYTKDGEGVFDGTVGTSNTNMVIENASGDEDGVNIQLGSRVSVLRMVYEQREQ